MKLPIDPPRQVNADVALGESVTRYHGERVKVATLQLRGVSITLGLGDTARCAADIDSARATLQTYAERFKVPAARVLDAAAELHMHCRRLTKRGVDDVR